MWSTESEYPIELRRRLMRHCVLLEDVLPLFYLPAIETVELQCIDWTDTDIEWPAGLPCASSIHHLSIKDSEFRGNGLEMILKATPQLQCLKLDFEGGEIKIRYDDPDLPWEDIARAISFVKATIEQLTIGMHFFLQPNFEFYFTYSGPTKIIDFVDYTRLTRLEVLYDHSQRQYLLWFDGHLGNLLPQTLTDLILRDDRYTLDDTGSWDDEGTVRNIKYILASYLQHWRTCTPNLQKITIAVNGRGIAYKKSEYQKAFDCLWSICNAAGVACVLDPEVMANGV